MDSTVPFSVGGRQTMVGIALGIFRSIAKFFLPVTMSRASTRPMLWPTYLPGLSLSLTFSGLTTLDAASADSEP